jgi:hypothetical protein
MAEVGGGFEVQSANAEIIRTALNIASAPIFSLWRTDDNFMSFLQSG